MLCNVVLFVTSEQVCSQCDRTLAHARPKNVPVILAGVISEARKEDVLVYYGYDCRKSPKQYHIHSWAQQEQGLLSL